MKWDANVEEPFWVKWSKRSWADYKLRRAPFFVACQYKQRGENGWKVLGVVCGAGHELVAQALIGALAQIDAPDVEGYCVMPKDYLDHAFLKADHPQIAKDN